MSSNKLLDKHNNDQIIHSNKPTTAKNNPITISDNSVAIDLTYIQYNEFANILRTQFPFTERLICHLDILSYITLFRMTSKLLSIWVQTNKCVKNWIEKRNREIEPLLRCRKGIIRLKVDGLSNMSWTDFGNNPYMYNISDNVKKYHNDLKKHINLLFRDDVVLEIWSTFLNNNDDNNSEREHITIKVNRYDRILTANITVDEILYLESQNLIAYPWQYPNIIYLNNEKYEEHLKFVKDMRVMADEMYAKKIHDNLQWANRLDSDLIKANYIEFMDKKLNNSVSNDINNYNNNYIDDELINYDEECYEDEEEYYEDE